MLRFITTILLASVLVACGSPGATPTAGVAESSPVASATSTVLVSPTTAATDAPTSEPTLTPTAPAASPTLVATAPAALPTTAASPAASVQQTSTTTDDQTSIPGVVTIDAQRPIPPDAVLSVQLRQVNRDGIAFFTVIDEQRIPVQEPKPVSFVLTYTADDLVQPPAVTVPYAYEIHAQLNAPGRVPWYTNTQVDLQQLPSPFPIAITPRNYVAEVSGTLTIPEQPALPPDAVLTMRLTRERGYVGFEDVPEIVTSALKPGKLPFTLEYGTGAPTPETLMLHAEVRSGAKLLMISSLTPAVQQDQPVATIDAVLAQPQETHAITGTIVYTAENTLPADAVLTIELNDVSMADGPSYVFATQTITPVSDSPVSFAIEYDPALLKPDAYKYAVSAQIRSGEQLLFINDVMQFVLTDEQATTVDMALKRVGESQ